MNRLDDFRSRYGLDQASAPPRISREQGAAMERLEANRIHGHVHYYYSKWARKDGRCRRVWQRYLGKLEDIVQAVEGGPQPTHAEVFQFGLPEALWIGLTRTPLPRSGRTCFKASSAGKLSISVR